MPAASAPSPQQRAVLRAYVQNVCVLPFGARERHLQSGGAGGAALLLVSVLFGLRVVAGWGWPACAVAVGVLFGSGAAFVLVVHVVLGTMGGMSWICGRRHDFKRERLALLAQRLCAGRAEHGSPPRDGSEVAGGRTGARGGPSYDVVMLQEFYGSWYSDAHRHAFVAAMRRGGYLHHAMPPRTARLPSTWANSGLAVFSPHPICNARNGPFRTQTIYDRFCVNRGAFACDVAIPTGTSVGSDSADSAAVASGTSQPALLRVVSVHFGPPAAVLNIASVLPKWCTRLLDVHPQQVQELVAFVDGGGDAKASRGGLPSPPLLLAGDFNAVAGSPAYANVCRRLAEAGFTHLTEKLLGGACPPLTCNPPGERAITGGGREPHTLDYAFGRGLAAVDARVVSQASQDESCGFEYVSDHLGLHVAFSSPP